MSLLKAKFVLCTIILVSVLACLMIGLSGCKNNNLVVADFVEVSFSGKNDKGVASYSLKKDDLFNEIRNRVSEDKVGNTVIEFFIEEISSKLDPSRNLSNGDKIKLTTSYSKEYAKRIGVKFSAKGKNVVVSGLE